MAQTIKLNSGHTIPTLGLGTLDATPEVARAAVKEAIHAGYRHLDCAPLYFNQTGVGAAIKDCIQDGTIRREDLFVTSKLWNDCHRNVRASCQSTLFELGLEYMDLFIIHLATAAHNARGRRFEWEDQTCVVYDDTVLEDTWKAMEELVDLKLVRSIGVSNFNKHQLERVLKICRIKPAVNQFEVSINCTNDKLIKFCQDHTIQVEAYSPLGSAGVMKTPIPLPTNTPFVKAIAAKHNKTVAQVLLRDGLQRGLIMLAKSVTPSRIIENSKIYDFELSKDEMHELNTKGEFVRRFTFGALAKHPEYPFNAEY